MTTFSNTHHGHSSLVRHWRPAKDTKTVNVWKVIEEKWTAGELHRLKSPHQGHFIGVSFEKYPDHPEWTHVRCSNWRCEHEPHGVYPTPVAREFYRSLVQAGFVSF